jgi:hypothetical protein
MIFGKTRNSSRGKCPLNGKTCCEGECAWWVSIEGVNKNTGENVKTHDCVVTTLPLLLIESSSHQRSTTAAVESFRNESINRTNSTNTILAALAQATNAANIITPVEIRQLED